MREPSLKIGLDSARSSINPMFFERLIKNRYPALDWIQVEISSYCNAECIYCPHTVYRKNWQNRYLPVDAFRSLMPAFRKANLVYLQGWGEPFTHPNFFEMLKLSKKAGCRVGTTTNGTLLNRDLIEKLIAEGLDVIGFSLAGVDQKNDVIRKQTRLEKVLKSIQEIHRARQKYKSDTPAVHIAYMLLRSGLDDLEKLPKFLRDTGADQTVISPLSFVADPTMEPESILASSEKEYFELKHRLLKVKDESAALGAAVYFQWVSPLNQDFRCSENIPHAVVIGSDGSVSPCVMKQMPVKGCNLHYGRRLKYIQQNLSFGNIQQEPLNIIWHTHRYRRFIQKILSKKAPMACWNCSKGQIEKH